MLLGVVATSCGAGGAVPRFRHRDCRISLQTNGIRRKPSHLVAAVFFCAEVNTRKSRRRVKNGFEQRSLDVEREIFQFMHHSGKPNAFPTKEELTQAGRTDLVDAVIEQGSWLAIAWDTAAKKLQLNGHINGSRHKKMQNANQRAGFQERFDTAEVEVALQRTRAEIVSFKEERKKQNVKKQNAVVKVATHAEPAVTIEQVKQPYTPEKIKSNRMEDEAKGETSHRRKRRKEPEKVKTDDSSVNTALGWIKDMVDKREQLVQQLRSKSSPSSPPSASAERRSTVTSIPTKSSSKVVPETLNLPRETDKSSSTLSPKQSLPDNDTFSARIRKLETKLLATRAALKSSRTALLKGEDSLMQVQRKSSEEFSKAADSLEFRESEILKTRSELRRTRAQVNALQAKFAVELSEARKAAEEKQLLLDKAERALRMMRHVRIAWQSPASQVQLAGSFNGWTNKIVMERSGVGFFVTNLYLYPGRYEIKFVVDGTWKVDPCRPVTYCEDGIENNVLTVC